METFLECWEVSKYYSKIVWEFFFCSLYLKQWFEFLKIAPSAERGMVYHQKKNNKSWKSSNNTFWPKSNMRKNVNRKLFKLIIFRDCHTLYGYYKLEKGSEVVKRSNYWSLKEIWTSYKQFVYTDNQGQNIWNIALPCVFQNPS